MQNSLSNLKIGVSDILNTLEDTIENLLGSFIEIEVTNLAAENTIIAAYLKIEASINSGKYIFLQKLQKTNNVCDFVA